MSAHTSSYKRCVSRANLVGVMILLITLCQYAIPAVFAGVLRLCGADIAAAFWGLPAMRYLWLYCLMYLLMTVVPLWLCTAYLLPPRPRRTTPPLRAGRTLRLVLFCVALCMLANIFATFLTDMLYALGLPSGDIPAISDGTLAVLLVDILVFALVPAVMEELLLRRVVLDTLRPLGDTPALLVSALLFGLLHGNLAQAPYACLMGLVLGGLYLHTSSLRPVIAVHAISNTLAVIMNYLRLYCTSATASLWGLVILVVVLMLGGISSFWLWRHPLDRKPTVVPEAPRALQHAPLLWGAVGILLLVLLLRLFL